MAETGVIEDILTDSKDETDLAKVVDILLNSRHKRRKTILRNRQVSSLTTMDVLAQIYDIPFLKQWVDNYTEWRTSGDGGQGRKDIVDITKFSIERQNRMQDRVLDAMQRS